MSSSKQLASNPSSDSVKTFNRAMHLRREDPELRIHYVETLPRDTERKKGTILLIHGFPETSYQFRHVMAPLAMAGYHVIAPDKTGHGFSSKPVGDVHQQDPFTKRALAQDLHTLLTTHIGVQDKVHVVGHDIGGMVAHAYACQFPEHVASVIWGECPLPGSTIYESQKHSRALWHFDFQSHHPELAVALVTAGGRDSVCLYLTHFYDRLTQNQAAAFPPEAVDFYVARFSVPDALRCAFLTYRAFERDAVDNRRWRDEQQQQGGKSPVRCMLLTGDAGVMTTDDARAMAEEFYHDVTLGVVRDSGHYLAEENPDGFVQEVLKFVGAGA